MAEQLASTAYEQALADVQRSLLRAAIAVSEHPNDPAKADPAKLIPLDRARRSSQEHKAAS